MNKIPGFTTAQAYEGIRKHGALLNASGMSIAAMLETHEHRRLREQIEQTYSFGLVMGLTEDQIQEVVKAWEVHFQSTPFPVDWVEVRESLACRARGEGWAPHNRSLRLE